MLLLVSFTAALLLLLGSASLFFVFDLSVWLFHAPVIAAVQLSLRRPFHEAAVAMMVLAYFADLMASGPPGVHGLTLTLVFFGIVAISPRVGGRHLLASLLFAFVASFCVDLGDLLLYSLFYPEHSLAPIFVITVLPTALLTALLSVPYLAGLTLLEKRWRERTERSIVV